MKKADDDDKKSFVVVSKFLKHDHARTFGNFYDGIANDNS